MYCNQCEQTAKGVACTIQGVCGKKPEVAAIQDCIVYAVRGLALAALKCEEKGVATKAAGRLCASALFATVTNVNFDKEPLLDLLNEVVAERDRLIMAASISPMLPVLEFHPAQDEQALLAQAAIASVTKLAEDPDCNSLAQTVLYGLKGVAAYADHAAILGQESEVVYRAMFTLLALGFDGGSPSLGDWVNAALECGKVNLAVMELLDGANTGTYGHPEPTEVALKPKPGKAILVSGHDLKDLYTLLVQTQETGINIYTHGEMLPAHAYPGLKKFPHLAGHFGTAWQNQEKEFRHFPGAVLFTTNCIQRPAEIYRDTVFTTGLVGWPGVTHVRNGDFGPVIEKARALPGFTEETVNKHPAGMVLAGFGRNAVLSVAETVIRAVQSGAIKHFFLVGGCDGAKPGRNYYTEFVEKTPPDTVVLTLACGKFRFFDKNLGSIGGIPRLLDVGQCNDAFSAIKIAGALADAFECDVNELPLSMVLSWYEQKAVAILLSLLALNIQNIRLGPSVPAFITPGVLQVLADTFNIMPIDTPERDLKAILGA